MKRLHALLMIPTTMLTSLTCAVSGFQKHFGVKLSIEESLLQRQRVRAASCRQEDVSTGRTRLANSSVSRTALSVGVRYKNFEDMLESNPGETVLVYFSAVNCGPCRIQKKELMKVQQLLGEKCKIFAVDTETWPHVGSRFKVHALPCLVVFKDGELLHRFEGVTHATDVVQQLQIFL